MKTIKLFFIATAVFAIGFFTSCTKDTVATGPTIEFISGTDIITADATVETVQSFTFKWLVTQGTAKLSQFTIRLSNADLDGFPKTDIPADSYSDLLSTSQATAGVYIYTFIATDKDGMEDSKTITITVNEPIVIPTINTYTDKILGASQNNDYGSSFASIDGSTFKLVEAKTNSTKVDFVYFYGATNLATLAAPSDADAQAVFSNATSGIATWATINATILGATALTPAEFDAISSETDVITAATGLTATKVNNLAVGNVIAFQTAATSANPSKKGLIKVVAIAIENTGTITIEVKVQK